MFMSKEKKRMRLIVNVLTVLLVLSLYLILRTGILSGVIDRYLLDILNNILISVVMAVSLNLVSGLMGQLVLGHAGFMLVGAYVSALFTLNFGWALKYSLPISLILAGLVAAVMGIIVGVPALRLKGDYLAIITLGFGEIIRVVANNLKVTNGAKGLYGMDTLTTKDNPTGMFNLLFIVAIAVVYFSYSYGTSRHGRAVIAIREDEIAAESIGIQTTSYKLLTFTLAAFIAGVAGGLYAHQLGLIDPFKFDFNRSVEILVMVVLGGMGSITGAIISASILTALPELLRIFGGSASNFIEASSSGIATWIQKTPIMEVLRNFPDYRMLLYSIILICVMLFRPQGLFGRKEFSLTKIIEFFTGKGNKAKPDDVIESEEA